VVAALGPAPRPAELAGAPRLDIYI
jgi:hypothetical protein